MITETPPLSDEEFLARFGDAIDDRVAEILDELLDERNLLRRRPHPPWLLDLTIVALAVLAATVLLHSLTWTV
ncbi:MAG: hypothetical protein ABSB59_40805 [Streptosporangiaceae bacterium]